MSSKTQDPILQKNSKPAKKSLALKLIIFTIASIAIVYGGFSLRNNQPNLDSKTANSQQEDDLFDIIPNQDSEIDINEMKAQEINEKGSDFIYQLLIKNQSQIDELKTELQTLKSELSKYKSQDKVSKIALNYIDFRDKFFSKSDFKTSLANLELLSYQDVFLKKTFQDFKNLAPEFLNKEELESEFSALIPQLIAHKTSSDQLAGSKNIAQNLRYQLAKLITIRKLQSKNPREIDSVIVSVETNLKNQNYQDALNSISLLEQKYFFLLGDFIEKLNVAIEVKKTDEAALNYIKNLS